MSRHVKIFSTLRDRIVYLEYPPGMVLAEKDLCREFRVSRTPLREAIKKLESMGLVSVIPRYGTYVSKIDINDIRCAFEVKIKLEGLAGEIASRRITPDNLEKLRAVIESAENLSENDHERLAQIDAQFHKIIYEAAQNPILYDTLENLHSRCARLWISSLEMVVPNAEVVDQLWKIYGAIEDRDSRQAGDLLEFHVKYFIDKIKDQLL